MPKKIINWLIIILINIILSALIVIIAINVWVSSNAKSNLYDKIEDIPKRKVGLLLGTTSSYNGKPNAYFNHRIQAAAKLYLNGKIDYILVSGDNAQRNYNEPRDMRAALLKYNIPSGRIYLDYAGFRTLDSVVRAKEIFGESKLTVISQKFHNQRAVMIGKHYGLDIIGYNATDVPLKQGWKTMLREVFARVKLVWDLYTGVGPKFLGEEIDIG